MRYFSNQENNPRNSKINDVTIYDEIGKLDPVLLSIRNSAG